MSSSFVEASVGSQAVGGASAQCGRQPKRQATVCMMRCGSELSRRGLLQAMGAGELGALFFAALALVDHTYIAARRSYERFVWYNYPRPDHSETRGD